MKNITVIIPVHEFNEVVEGYLDKAIESAQKQEKVTEQPEIIIVHPENLTDVMNEHSKKHLGVVYGVNKGFADYQSQVNHAVDHVDTDYFTVLEFDDELGTTFIKNGNQYIKAYPEVDVFLTMLIEVNEKNEGIKMTNETVWSENFVGENGEMGYLNVNALKQYTDFKLSGAIIKKSEFINIGKYKINIKLAFMYEFMLRALNNACKIITISKIGYKHLATREGSLFDTYLKTMPMNERKFWFDTATNEANFMSDRTIDMSRLSKQIIV